MLIKIKKPINSLLNRYESWIIHTMLHRYAVPKGRGSNIFLVKKTWGEYRISDRSDVLRTTYGKLWLSALNMRY